MESGVLLRHLPLRFGKPLKTSAEQAASQALTQVRHSIVSVGLSKVAPMIRAVVGCVIIKAWYETYYTMPVLNERDP